ncbi:MAG: hypothetical protein Q7T97_08060 [Burkholderiaceae bacterium]|nr:hypothetical protein [Burkholderiaceae bacterium]
MPTRRHALLRMSVAACAAAPAVTRANLPRSRDDPFRLAVDQALAESGLASRLQRGFGRDAGIAIRLLPGPARDLLAELERGEHDGALLNAPQAEAESEQLGLLRDRRQIATVDFLIVGPTALRSGLDVLAAQTHVAPALSGLARVGAPFIGAPEGSGTRELESVLWRAARVAPQPSWYRSPAPGQSALAAARAGRACCLVERGVWDAAPPAVRQKDFGVLVDGDPLMQAPVHAMRSFHVDHPAGKLFMSWLSSRMGRQAISTLPAYRAVSP